MKANGKHPVVDSEFPGSIKPAVGWLVIALASMCAILMSLKQPWSPWAAWVGKLFSLEDLSQAVASELTVSIFVPLAALIVVFVRVTLGVRVLGPFRSILLAMAFRVTGPFYGMLYLIVAISLFLGLRPAIKGMKLPYFGRTTMMLCCVTLLMTLGALAAKWTQIQSLELIVFFPIVVLSLVADAFARVAAKEGVLSAIWRCLTTGALAIGIAMLMNSKGLREILLYYPELILLEMAGIIVVCRWLGWRLFDKFNPGVTVGSESSGENEDEEDEIRSTLCATTHRVGLHSAVLGDSHAILVRPPAGS